jgi:hypothetical protein
MEYLFGPLVRLAIVLSVLGFFLTLFMIYLQRNARKTRYRLPFDIYAPRFVTIIGLVGFAIPILISVLFIRDMRTRVMPVEGQVAFMVIIVCFILLPGALVLYGVRYRIRVTQVGLEKRLFGTKALFWAEVSHVTETLKPSVKVLSVYKAGQKTAWFKLESMMEGYAALRKLAIDRGLLARPAAMFTDEE